MRVFPYLILLLLLFGCASKKITDVAFLPKTVKESPKLNVFVPRHPKMQKLPVLIFMHGGNWNSGNKGLYGFFGRNFAKKGVVTVIPDYTLSPDANYDVMAMQTAEAIKWVQANISKYGGDPKAIFVTGHSAGGQLAALAVMNPKYGVDPNAISGIILNDAAGLDMKHYLEDNPPTTADDYLTTWTSNPEKWEDASPIYFLDRETPPFLIYVGHKTYGSIKTANARFLLALNPFQPNVQPIVINKKHVPMVLQYIWPWSNRFDEIVAFIRAHKVAG